MGMLLQLREYGDKSAGVSLVNANQAVGEILRIANFDKLFTIGADGRFDAGDVPPGEVELVLVTFAASKPEPPQPLNIRLTITTISHKTDEFLANFFISAPPSR